MTDQKECLNSQGGVPGGGTPGKAQVWVMTTRQGGSLGRRTRLGLGLGYESSKLITLL